MENTEQKQERKFEDAMKELDSIVKMLDKGDAPLEESMKIFEKGIALASYCQKLLDDAEIRINMVAHGENGDTLTDFPALNEE